MSDVSLGDFKIAAMEIDTDSLKQVSAMKGLGGPRYTGVLEYNHEEFTAE